MKNLLTLLMILSFTSMAFADERSCVKECRTKYQTCLDAALSSAEDGYIDVDSAKGGLSNKVISQMYQSVDEHHKELKKICRKDRDTCKESCNQD